MKFIKLLVILPFLPLFILMLLLQGVASLQNKKQLVPVGSSALSLSMLRRIVRRGCVTGDASQRHLTLLNNVLSIIPEPIRLRLAERGFLVVAPKTASSGSKDYRDLRHVAHCDSFLLEIVIPEWSSEPGWSAFYISSIEDVEYAVVHEVGHAIEEVMRWDRYFLLDDPKFVNAYNDDRRCLSLDQQLRETYFLQCGYRGRAEVFAELIANIFGSKRTESTVRAFPNTNRIVREQMELYLQRLAEEQARQEHSHVQTRWRLEHQVRLRMR